MKLRNSAKGAPDPAQPQTFGDIWGRTATLWMAFLLVLLGGVRFIGAIVCVVVSHEDPLHHLVGGVSIITLAAVLVLTDANRRAMWLTIGLLLLVGDALILSARVSPGAPVDAGALLLNNIGFIAVGAAVELLRFAASRGRMLVDRFLKASAAIQDELRWRAEGTELIYQQMVDLASEAILLVTPDSRIGKVNRQFEKLIGSAREDLVGQPLSALDPFFKRLLPEQYTAIGRRLEQGKSLLGLEVTIIGPDGSERFTEVDITHVHNDGSLMFMLRDVTARGVAERERYQWLTELAAINEIATVVNHSLRLEVVLQTALAALSMATTAEIIAIQLLDEAQGALNLAADLNFPPELAQALGRADDVQSIVGRVFTTREPVNIDETHFAEDLAARQVRELGVEALICAPLLASDAVTGVVVVASRRPMAVAGRPMTVLMAAAREIGTAIRNAELYEEVRRARDELEIRVQERTADLQQMNTAMRGVLDELSLAKARAEEADRLKSQLLSIVSHELRSPLATIKGFTTTMIDYADRLDDDMRAEFLGIIDAETDRLTELIENLLNMSRMEAGMLHVSKELVDLGTVIESVRQAAARLDSGREVSVTVDTSLPQVPADPRRIRQVLYNLVENATKYTPPGTPITICAALDGDHVLVQVIDRGPGIPPEHLDHLFERFYRIQYRDWGKRGVGLGLAICKGLIDAHGGRIWVESKPNEGCCFSFTLPLRNGADRLTPTMSP